MLRISKRRVVVTLDNDNNRGSDTDDASDGDSRMIVNGNGRREHIRDRTFNGVMPPTEASKFRWATVCNTLSIDRLSSVYM